jgi:hypothetical protein
LENGFSTEKRPSKQTNKNQFLPNAKTTPIFDSVRVFALPNLIGLGNTDYPHP